MIRLRYFRVLTPDGHLSQERFVLPPGQPSALPPGCVVVVHAETGTPLMVHDTRLFPAESAHVIPMPSHPEGSCRKCGRVLGIAQDGVACPVQAGGECGMTTANSGNELVAVH
jgi:hypothetical protein